METLTKKYAPKNIKEILGQEEAIKNIKKFLAGFKKSKKKAALFYGPTGTGKTSCAYAIADALNFEILDINVSVVISVLSSDLNIDTYNSTFSEKSFLFLDSLILVNMVSAKYGTNLLKKVIELSKPLNFSLALNKIFLYISESSP